MRAWCVLRLLPLDHPTGGGHVGVGLLYMWIGAIPVIGRGPQRAVVDDRVLNVIGLDQTRCFSA